MIKYPYICLRKNLHFWAVKCRWTIKSKIPLPLLIKSPGLITKITKLPLRHDTTHTREHFWELRSDTIRCLRTQNWESAHNCIRRFDWHGRLSNTSSVSLFLIQLYINYWFLGQLSTFNLMDRLFNLYRDKIKITQNFIVKLFMILFKMMKSCSSFV